MSSDWEPLYDYNDDEFWDKMLLSEASVLETTLDDLRQELGDIDEERAIRRAEWDEYSVEYRDIAEYRKELAVYSRWRADMFSLYRVVSERRDQVKAALKDQVGAGESDTARNIIHRLCSAIIRTEDGVSEPENDLFKVLDRTYLVAQGRKMSLREFVENGSRW